MAAIRTQISIPLVNGIPPIICDVGTIGRGKGASKVRLVPATKDEQVLIALLKALPKWPTILQTVIAKIYSTHSTACISGVPAVLTEESLKEAVANDSLVFDQQALNESVEDDYTNERTGRVSAEKKLLEWTEQNQARVNELMKNVLSATQRGEAVDDSEAEELNGLMTAQTELLIATASEQAAKESRAAARAAKAK